MIFIAHIGEIYYKGFVLKQSLKETHSFAPSFNLRCTNTRRANLRRASGDPPSLGAYYSPAIVTPNISSISERGTKVSRRFQKILPYTSRDFIMGKSLSSGQNPPQDSCHSSPTLDHGHKKYAKNLRPKRRNYPLLCQEF